MTDLYRTLAAYNEWMNRRIFETCSRLSDESRKLDRRAFFRSIHGTLNHLLYGDRAWMNRLADRSYECRGANGILYQDFDSLWNARCELDQAINEWVAELEESWFGESLTWTSMIDGKTRTQPHWLLLSHMFNHGTHHRGQLSTLLNQVGVDVGTTDLPWVPSEI